MDSTDTFRISFASHHNKMANKLVEIKDTTTDKIDLLFKCWPIPIEHIIESNVEL